MRTSAKSYHDIVGDGGSDILGQVEKQQQRLRANLAGIRHRVAIGSGKGGVGKSTLTRHLASAAVRRGWRTAILDADFNGPTQARLAGIAPAPPIPGERGLVLARSRDGIGILSLGTFVGEDSALEFESVAQGDSHTWRATREFTSLGEILSSVEWGELDLLIFDLPPGSERTLQFAEFFGPEVVFLLVTLPSAIAAGVVARSIAALDRTPSRVLGHVLNMDGYACASCGEVGPLFPAQTDMALTTDLLGSVPFDPALASLSDRGGTLDELPDSPAALAIDKLAGRLMDLLEAR